MSIDHLMIENINLYLKNTPNEKYAIDIGCSDNSYLINLSDYKKILIDYDSAKIGRINKIISNDDIINVMVSHENIISILENKNIPKNISFLNIDIDGIDLHVMDVFLKTYKPYLICTEINEKIPPPIKFCVNKITNFIMDDSHMYGYSIMCLKDIMEKYGYDIVKLEWNNVFLIKKELNTFGSMSIEDAYNNGYALRQDREKIFYYNSNMQFLLENHSDEEKINFINSIFKKYNGMYSLEL